jgi:hypothetical protein
MLIERPIFWEGMLMKDNTFTPKFDEISKCTILVSTKMEGLYNHLIDIIKHMATMLI